MKNFLKSLREPVSRPLPSDNSCPPRRRVLSEGDSHVARDQPFLRDRNSNVRRDRRPTSSAPFPRLLPGRRRGFAIDDMEVIGGSLPARQARLVIAWAEIHRKELLENWEALQEGRRPAKIDPLR